MFLFFYEMENQFTFVDVLVELELVGLGERLPAELAHARPLLGVRASHVAVVRGV